MPATSTAKNACNAVIKVDNGAGVLADISGSMNEVNVNLDNKLGEVKVFGSDFPRRLACGRDAALDTRFVYSGSDAESAYILLDWWQNHHEDARTMEFYLPDENPGADKISGEFMLENLRLPGKADDANPILGTASFKPDGDVTWAVQGS